MSIGLTAHFWPAAARNAGDPDGNCTGNAVEPHGRHDTESASVLRSNFSPSCTGQPNVAAGPIYEISGDAFPTTDSGYWLVDLHVALGSATTVPVTPATVTLAAVSETGIACGGRQACGSCRRQRGAQVTTRRSRPFAGPLLLLPTDVAGRWRDEALLNVTPRRFDLVVQLPQPI